MLKRVSNPSISSQTADPARNAACRHLARLAEQFPDLDPTPLDDAEFGSGTDARDAALGHAIVDGAIERWLTIAYLAKGYLSRPDQPLRPHAQAAILAGATQLLFLDRVPAYAAINHAVGWVKASPAGSASGLVNAVLRRLAELAERATIAHSYTDGLDEIPLADGRCLKLPAKVLPSDPMVRLSVVASHPVDVVRMWRRVFGESAARSLALHSLVRPPTVLHAPPGASLPTGEGFTPHESPRHVVWSGNRAGLVELLRSRPDIWVQDASSSRGVLGVHERVPSPRLILDVCAGQGTKTRQLAACFPGAPILATDTDPRRLATLAASFREHPHVRVIPSDEIRAQLMTEGKRAELILLDVPCTNSGTLARRSEARYRLATGTYEAQLARLGAIQREIVAAAVSMLAPGGYILYSTCSIDAAEDRAIADWSAGTFGLSLVCDELTLPQGLPGEPVSAYRDGSYWALLQSPR